MALTVWTVKSWKGFCGKVDLIRTGTTIAGRVNTVSKVSTLLFRGQADAKWTLDTTLERFDNSLTLMERYYRGSARARSQIEAHTKKTWRIMRWPSYRKITTDSNTNFNGYFPSYEYLAYLRHHGFPSPLLDWSRSPFVAAFFAFRNVQPRASHVAVYAYCADVGLGRVGAIGEPQIYTQGPYVSTHARHFLQQSEYTICVQYRANAWHYCNHETVLAAAPPTLHQDMMFKIRIPVRLRDSVLSRLDEYNVNAYSLLQTEDALMEMMARRELTA